MLSTPAEFPHAGSRAFLATSADPVTIIRRNADGSALVRRDARPFSARNRDASGNTTVPLAELFADADEAARAGLKQRSGRPDKNTPRPAKPRRARKARK